MAKKKKEKIVDEVVKNPVKDLKKNLKDGFGNDYITDDTAKFGGKRNSGRDGEKWAVIKQEQ